MPTYQYRCNECSKSFERTETITEHEAAKVRCPKCNSKKVTQVPGRVHVVTSKKVRGSLADTNSITTRSRRSTPWAARFVAG